MKKNLSIWSLVVCAGLVLSGMGLFAQTGTETRYSIPFEFLVGNTLMPAGEYTVKPLSLISPKNTRILQKTDRSKAVFVALGATENNTETDSCKLIFSQMEEGYRLSRIHERNGVMALADAKGKSDKTETGNMKVAILKPAKIVVVKAL